MIYKSKGPQLKVEALFVNSHSGTKKPPLQIVKVASKVIRVRFELTTHGLEDRCSIQLSYQTIEFTLAAQEQ